MQPPVHALAAWLVHCADPGLSRARGFLAGVYPRLAAWHRYLLHRRDLGGGGLASVVHPWEQGMDNSPCWDAPLGRITPAPARSFRRADLDHGAAEDRPTDLDYGRYVRLATDYRDGRYADGASEFAVEDPSFNALLIASEHALARIARELGATGTARHARAERLTGVLIDRLWDPAEGMFFCRDVRGEGLIPERSVSGLIPLLLPDLPRDIATALVRTASGPHFGLGDTTRLPPSYDLLGEAFDPRPVLARPGLVQHELAAGARPAAARRAHPGGGAARGGAGDGRRHRLRRVRRPLRRRGVRRDRLQLDRRADPGSAPRAPGPGVSGAALGTFDMRDTEARDTAVTEVNDSEVKIAGGVKGGDRG